MNSKEIIGLSVLLGLVAFGRVAQLYIWPRLQVMDREGALNALIAPHMFRYAGLSFLMPGVVSPQLSPAFALPAAYGDLTAALLAIVATFALSARASWAIAVVWLFNIVGSIDLLFAYYQGVGRHRLRAGCSRCGVLYPDGVRASVARYALPDVPTAVESGPPCATAFDLNVRLAARFVAAKAGGLGKDDRCLAGNIP